MLTYLCVYEAGVEVEGPEARQGVNGADHLVLRLYRQQVLRQTQRLQPTIIWKYSGIIEYEYQLIKLVLID